jgi:hypothetical protein
MLLGITIATLMPSEAAQEISVAPGSFDFEVPVGGTDSATMTIGNGGDVGLGWSLGIATGGTDVIGDWLLLYDWGCQGTPASDVLTLQPDFTFTTSDGFSGTWTQTENLVVITFASGAEYIGYVAGNIMAGTSSSPTGSPGCWEAQRVITVAVATVTGEHDLSGEIASNPGERKEWISAFPDRPKRVGAPSPQDGSSAWQYSTEFDPTTGEMAFLAPPKELETLSSVASGGNVLWDLTHGVLLGYEPSGDYSSLVSLLGSTGYSLSTTSAGVDNVNLSDFDVVVVNLGSAWNSAYTTSEVSALVDFVQNGGGLLIMCDNTSTPNSNVNPVAQAFGTTCGVSNSQELITNLSPHSIFEGVSEIDMTVFAGEVTTVSPSQLVAFDSVAKGVVSVAEDAAGKVVVVGDINLWADAEIAMSDNQLFAERTFHWLSASWLAASPRSGSVPALGFSPVTVAVDATEYRSGEYGLLLVRSDDPDEALIAVPVSLTVRVAVDVGPIVYDSQFLDDDNLGNSIGNGDGLADAGETIEMYVDLRNYGMDTATGVDATITTSDPYVVFTFNTSSAFGDIAGGGTARNLNDFDFSLDPAAPFGHIIEFTLDVTATNGGPWSVNFSVAVHNGSPTGSVALISDQEELALIAPIVNNMGLSFDVLDYNWNPATSQAVFTSDLVLLSNYDVVVWYGSGTGVGRLITNQERGALEQYLQAGGRLVVTGYDTLGSPTDPLMQDLIRSSSSGDGPFTLNYTITNGDHPITKGLYGWFGAGTPLTANHSDHDQAEADPGQGAITIAELTGGRDKIVSTEFESGGVVVYWNGNYNATDWTGIAAIIPSAAGLENIERKNGEKVEPAVDLLREVAKLPLPTQGAFVVEGHPSDSPPPSPPLSVASSDSADNSVAAPALTVIDFDDTPQPCAFASTTALRTAYSHLGVVFSGPSALDGGAILDECGGFGVTGYSPPSFLAFNNGSVLSGGGVPRGPETIWFNHAPASFVQISGGSASGAGQTLTMDAYDAGGTLVATNSMTLSSTLQPLSVSYSGIARVVIDTPATVFVLDDLQFEVEIGAGPGGTMFKNMLHWLALVPPPGDSREPNNSPDECTPISFGVPVTEVTIEPAGDYDYYCFTGSAGQEIAADVDAWEIGSTLDSVLTLFDVDGTTVLTSNDDFHSLDSYFEYVLPADGQYFLRVRSFGHPCCGGPDYFYTLLLSDITWVRTLPFVDDVEMGLNGWAADGLWHQVQDGVSPYPNSMSPTHSWWYGQDSTGSYDNGVANSGALTSPPIALPPGLDAGLSFWNWYETEPQLLPQNIYFDIYHDTDGDDTTTGIYADWASELTSFGFGIAEFNEPIELGNLLVYDVLALFDPEVALTSAEIEAITEFMILGGRVVVLGEWTDLDGVNTVLNVLTSGHGVTLNTDTVQDPTNNDGFDYWPLIYNFADDPLVRNVNEMVLFAGASLTLGGPAVALATGDSDTTIATAIKSLSDTSESGVGLESGVGTDSTVPGAPVVMAYAPVGDGQLIVIGDSSLWSIEDADGDGTPALYEYGNLQLAYSLFGREVDAPAWDQKRVQVSVDGGPYVDLLQVTGGPMYVWHPIHVDLSAFAGSTIRIRFYFDTLDATLNGFRGWYVDDVIVASPPEIDISPTSFSFQVDEGQIANDGLTIFNLQPGFLDWLITAVTGGASVPGDWRIFFDWFCDGSPPFTLITLNPDYTFTTGDGGSGTWAQSDNEVFWTFSTGTQYIGYVAGDIMAGRMTGPSGEPGCWHAELLTPASLTLAEGDRTAVEDRADRPIVASARSTDAPVEVAPADGLAPALPQVSGGNVLWDLTHGVYLDYHPAADYSDLVAMLGGAGYRVETTAESVESVALWAYDVVVVNLGSAWDSAYTPSEVAALQDFVRNGGGLLVICDNAGTPNANVNPVAQAFGTTCGGTNTAEVITNLFPHSIFEGVTQVDMTSWAGELSSIAPSQLVAFDSLSRGVVAVAEEGTGRVVVLGDLNTWENANLGNADNLLFAARTFDWLSADWLGVAPREGSIEGAGSNLVTVTADTNEYRPGEYGLLLVHSNDPDEALTAVPVSLVVCPPDLDGDGYRPICDLDCDDTNPTVNPGAPELCADGIDNDCNPATPDDWDGDFDGLLCSVDCDDNNADAWATPGEVQTLLLDHDVVTGTTTLSWSPPADLGASSVVYDTIRAWTSTGFDSGDCVESNDGSDLSCPDTLTLGPGDLVFFLIRAENDCPLGQGSLGWRTGGPERTGMECPPPPKSGDVP